MVRAVSGLGDAWRKAEKEVMAAVKRYTVAMSVGVLNRALSSDPEAIRKLFAYRVECNEKLVNDPTIQVRCRDGEPPTIGVLGLINGLLGVDEHEQGYIFSIIDEDDEGLTRITRFTYDKQPVFLGPRESVSVSDGEGDWTEVKK